MPKNFRSLIVPFFATFLTTSTAWACSCMNTAGVCSLSQAVVVARVIRDSGEKWGKGPGRVKVEEVLRGPTDIDEVEVETAAGTSCYGRLEQGKRYVLYGDLKNGVPHFSIRSCSLSFQLQEGQQYILDALRNAAKDGPFQVVGKVFAKGGEYSSDGEGVPGARVIGESRDRGGKKVEAVTDQNGVYNLLGLAPGRYKLSVTHPSYSLDESWKEPDDETPEPGKVRFVYDWPWMRSGDAGATGCQVRNLAMWPNGGITGRVTDKHGKPVADVEVGAYQFTTRIQGKEQLETRPLHSAKTGANGEYFLSKMPPGAYVVGINADKWDDRSPYPHVAYPGARDAESGERITLAKLEQRKGIDLTVSPPRKPVKVRVLVTMADGSPVEKALLSVEDERGVQRFFKTEATNSEGIGALEVYQGERYKIQSRLFSANGMYEGSIGLLKFSEADASVQVVLVQKEFPPRRK